jgi:tetratricopeptide (TPR) repeat protein
VGEIYERLGQYANAETAFRQAARILEAQRSQFPEDADLAIQAAETRNKIGNVLYASGEYPEARAQFEVARQILAGPRHNLQACRYELARTHSHLAVVSWRLWQPREAAENRRQAVELLEQLVLENTARSDYRLSLARAYLYYSPNPADGKTYRKESLALLSALAEEFPEVPDYQCELSEALTMANSRARDSDVEPQLRQAVGLAERIVDDYPTIPRYRATWARASYELASLLQKSGRTEEAEPWSAKAVKLYDSLHGDFPTIDAYQFLLGKSLHTHGDILRELNRLVESREHLEQALTNQRQYLLSQPRRGLGRGTLAKQLKSLSLTLAQLGEDEPAAEYAQEADEIRHSLARQFGTRQREDGDKAKSDEQAP